MSLMKMLLNKYMQNICRYINSLIKHEKGMALVLVLVFTTLLLVVGSAMLTFALTEMEISGYHSENLKQYYLAEAGLEAALTLLSNNPWERESISATLGEGYFFILFEEPADGELIISSTGYLADSSSTIKMRLNQHPDGTLEIDQWFKP